MKPINVIWQDIECGAYAADLKLWEALADETEGSVLDLGCGTGRVSLHLAKRENRMVGLDSNASLLAAFDERADGLPATAKLGDARGFDLEDEFGLVLAPMQLVQLFADAGERVDCLRCVERHMRTGGVAAFAIVEEMPPAAADLPPLPDVREVDGWVFSSLPLDADVDAGAIAVRRLRQTVSPEGVLSEEVDAIDLRLLSANTLEAEAVEAGLRPAGRREVPATDDHVGSTVILLEAP
jgi:SAM-dependent methyltransferase